MDEEPAPLSVDSVASYLIDRGVLSRDARWTVSPLSGGVSSIVLDVATEGRRLVVKQPLGRFAVPDEWIVKRERVLVEAEAMRVAADVIPGAVPDVIDVDHERLVVTMAGAPSNWRSWKQELLAGEIRPEVAAELGRLLTRWHAATTDEGLLARFDDPEIFDEQRADPYYRTTMDRRPELAGPMGALLERMLATKTCLVHGDFSPKNVLVGRESEPLLIDWEITHAGDPAFDLAFMSNHLMLKAIHRPQDADGYRSCLDAFWDAYGEVADPAYVFAHVGCLMVARVDGKSPAEYLTDRQAARGVGSGLVVRPASTLEDAWERLTSL